MAGIVVSEGGSSQSIVTGQETLECFPRATSTLRTLKRIPIPCTQANVLTVVATEVGGGMVSTSVSL